MSLSERFEMQERLICLLLPVMITNMKLLCLGYLADK